MLKRMVVFEVVMWIRMQVGESELTESANRSFTYLLEIRCPQACFQLKNSCRGTNFGLA